MPEGCGVDFMSEIVSVQYRLDHEAMAFSHLCKAHPALIGIEYGSNAVEFSIRGSGRQPQSGWEGPCNGRRPNHLHPLPHASSTFGFRSSSAMSNSFSGCLSSTQSPISDWYHSMVLHWSWVK